jgi:hypothetical protein
MGIGTPDSGDNNHLILLLIQPLKPRALDCGVFQT